MARKLAAAVTLGKRRMEQLTPDERTTLASSGGKVGGKARAKALTPAERKTIATKASVARMKKLTSAERQAIARQAAAARWGRKKAKVQCGIGRPQELGCDDAPRSD